MRHNKNFIIFIILILVNIKLYAQSNNATIQETFEWLKGKLDMIDSDYSRTLSFDKSNCTLIVESVKTDQVAPYIAKETIPISKVDPSSITISEAYYAIFISFKIIGDKELIHRVVTETKWDKINDVWDNSTSFHLPLSVKQNNIPERIKTALKHLIKLCGGKQEKF